MIGARLGAAVLLKLAIIGAFAWLVFTDHAAWALPLLALFLTVPLDAKPAPKPATPATPPKP